MVYNPLVTPNPSFPPPRVALFLLCAALSLVRSRPPPPTRTVGPSRPPPPPHPPRGTMPWAPCIPTPRPWRSCPSSPPKLTNPSSEIRRRRRPPGPRRLDSRSPSLPSFDPFELCLVPPKLEDPDSKETKETGVPLAARPCEDDHGAWVSLLGLAPLSVVHRATPPPPRHRATLPAALHHVTLPPPRHPAASRRRRRSGHQATHP
nr:unnamed protein product [Digitaria exilis]